MQRAEELKRTERMKKVAGTKRLSALSRCSGGVLDVLSTCSSKGKAAISGALSGGLELEISEH
jgi:hypothetical protein